MLDAHPYLTFHSQHRFLKLGSQSKSPLECPSLHGSLTAITEILTADLAQPLALGQPRALDHIDARGRVSPTHSGTLGFLARAWPLDRIDAQGHVSPMHSGTCTDLGVSVTSSSSFQRHISGVHLVLKSRPCCARYMYYENSRTYS